ncbi:hypothetical protein SEUCBS140593_000251 [Sporothrix eucalyptigena]|uniref:Autophagy-related protein 28 n=1 Tax=Sporothrix eucalyptigena TaxID=1812306 RepID=A0ABP0AN51_9PEZI
MANSSFLSRFSLSRDDAPMLPLHTKPLRHKPSEYDLEELSPRPSPSVLFSAPDADPPDFFPESPPAKARPSSVSFAYQDAYRDKPSSSRASSRQSHDYDDSPSRTPRQPVLFAGPPPPIARSMLMYRDVEDRSGSVLEHGRRRLSNNNHPDMSTASSIRLPTNTVLLDRRQHPSSSVRRGNKGTPFDGDSTWTILQRRERALQLEIQNYLDVQSAGLSAGLGRGPLNPSPSPGPSSDGGFGGGSDRDGWQNRGRGGGSKSSRSNTPTAESMAGRSLRLPTERATATGAVIPVRQPRPRKLGLRAARSGLARSISLLADLKAEEDASLTTALLARKRALAHLRRLSGRRDDIARELQTLETDNGEPLTRELITLRSAHASTSQQIAELEGQLAMLKQRKRTLETRIEDTMSQRESGLSGYRGALKEVEAQLTAVLRRPPIQPLDADTFGAGGAGRADQQEGGIRLEDRDSALDDADADASAGMEFLRLLPERRTAEMAKFWWDNEMRLLEKRRTEVGAERAALEEGGVIWQEAVQLVSDFEANLRKEMAAGNDGTGDGEDDGNPSKGKARAPTPEDRMRIQLQTMTTVIKGLRGHLRTAEDRGWNLLICAIGAELEAFQEARNILCQALRDAGFEINDAEDEDEDEDKNNDQASNSFLIDTRGTATTAGTTATPPGFGLDDLEDNSTTPRLARSTNDASASAATTNAGRRDRGYNTASESDDNDVPPDLLVTHDHDDGNSSTRGSQGRHNDKDDSSENEVPPEFLSEHQPDDDGEP